MKSPTWKQPRKPDDFTDPHLASDRNSMTVQSWAWEFDREITKANHRWGHNRLPYLVNPKLRAAYWAGIEEMNTAIRANSLPDVERTVTNMLRGLLLLNRDAVERQEQENPVLGRVEGQTAAGEPFVIVATHPPHSYRDSSRPDLVVYDVTEIALMLDQLRVVNKVKTTFAGATVTAIRDTNGELLDDDIPVF